MVPKTMTKNRLNKNRSSRNSGNSDNHNGNSKNEEKYVAQILKHEGGYVNHPNDRGGPTNYGITIHTLSQYLQRKVSIEEVKNLDMEVAKEIYLSRYFYAPNIHRLPEAIQIVGFDMSINHGARRSVKIIQRTVRTSEIDPKIVEDGILGRLTIKSCFEAQEELGDNFNDAICVERALFYRKIVLRRPNQIVFIHGWLNRAKHYLFDKKANEDLIEDVREELTSERRQIYSGSGRQRET